LEAETFNNPNQIHKRRHFCKMTDNNFNTEFQPIPTHSNFKDVTGTIYGRLTVIGFGGRERIKTFWYCKCECGAIKRILASLLQSGKTQSCGCLRKETSTILSTTHGMRHTPEYRSYVHAKDRCNNPNDKRHKDYGGRGIEFRFESYQEFLDEIGRKPSPEHSLDRIDNNGDYIPGNVRWATAIEQRANQRSYKPKLQQSMIKKILKDLLKLPPEKWSRLPYGYNTGRYPKA